MKFGKLTFQPVAKHLELVAEPIKVMLAGSSLAENILVSQIDTSLADTAAFCEHYEIGPEVSANCVIVEAKRGDRVWYAACVLLATTKADINGIIRKQLEARKTSFAAMDTATTLSHMEYGGITPIGLPADWTILVDSQVAKTEKVVIGSGIRGSKLLVPGALLSHLPNATTLEIIKP